MKLLKSPSSGRELSLALQQGVDVTLIDQTWQAAFDADLPRLLGCVGFGAGSKRLCHDLASTTWVLVCSLVSQLTQNMWSHQFFFPYAFLGLVSDSDTQVQETLQHAKTCWQVFQSLEETALTDAGCRAFVQSLPCCQDQFTREVLVRLRERQFAEVPPFLLRQLQSYASTFGGTLIIENCFRELRAAQRQHMSNQMPPDLAFHSSLLSEYGHTGLPVPSQSLDESRELLSKQLFERPSDAGECSVPLKALAENRRGGFSALSYEAWNSSVIRLLSAIKCKGRWAELSRAWQSQALLPRSFAVHTPTQQGFLIMLSTSWGCITWECEMREAKRDDSGYRLDGQKLAAGQLQLLTVTNMDNWLAYDVSAQLHIQGRKTPLYQFAARRGFPGLPLACLRQLLVKKGIPEESSAKADVVRKLIRDAFPDMSDEEVKNCESDEGGYMASPEYEPVVADEALIQGLGEVVDDQGGQQEEEALLRHLLEERDRLRASREVRRAQAPAQREERVERRRLPFKGVRGLTQKEAREYCPAGWGLSKDMRRHRRCQITERSSGRSFFEDFLDVFNTNRWWGIGLLFAEGMAGACSSNRHRVPVDLWRGIGARRVDMREAE